MVGFVPAGTAPPSSSKPTESQPTYLVSNALPQGQSVDENRSLYDILQANKQKKQEEFEEKLKFKNQFRGLEGDEAEFLDSILESERAAEDARKREIKEGLEAYRRRVEEAERESKLDDSAATVEDVKVEWTTKKRRRGNEKEGGALPGLKVRRVSTKGSEEVKKDGKETAKTEEKTVETKVKVTEEKDGKVVEKKETITATTAASTTKASPTPPTKPAGLASLLGDYDSDDSD